MQTTRGDLCTLVHVIKRKYAYIKSSLALVPRFRREQHCAAFCYFNREITVRLSLLVHSSGFRWIELHTGSVTLSHDFEECLLRLPRVE